MPMALELEPQPNMTAWDKEPLHYLASQLHMQKKLLPVLGVALWWEILSSHYSLKPWVALAIITRQMRQCMLLHSFHFTPDNSLYQLGVVWGSYLVPKCPLQGRKALVQ